MFPSSLWPVFAVIIYQTVQCDIPKKELSLGVEGLQLLFQNDSERYVFNEIQINTSSGSVQYDVIVVR